MSIPHPLLSIARHPPVKFSAVVMAGGRSMRMGTDKAFLHTGKELLIQRQLRCLQGAGAAELLISGREGVDYSSFKTKIIYDQQPGTGPLGGLAAALKAASHAMLLVLAVDMPEMTSAMLQRLLAHCGENFGCVPVDDGGFQPLAALYPKSALALAGSHLVAGRFSMRAFVRDAVSHGLVHPIPLQPSEQIYFTNWNHPSDWPADG